MVMFMFYTPSVRYIMTAKVNQLNGFESFSLEYGTSEGVSSKISLIKKYPNPTKSVMKNIICASFVV